MAGLMKTEQILKMLPQRYPFLLIDRVTEFTENESITAYKNLTFNEPFFQGHFPGMPVMPGVLIIEAMAQAGAILISGSLGLGGSDSDSVCMITGIEKARFRKPVYPGDRLTLKCMDFKHRMQLWKMQAKAYVDDVLVAEAQLTASVTKKAVSD